MLCGRVPAAKSTTWGKRLYFPSEGMHAEDFFFRPEKFRPLRPGLNSRTLVPKASTVPLDHQSRYDRYYIKYICTKVACLRY